MGLILRLVECRPQMDCAAREMHHALTRTGPDRTELADHAHRLLSTSTDRYKRDRALDALYAGGHDTGTLETANDTAARELRIRMKDHDPLVGEQRHRRTRRRPAVLTQGVDVSFNEAGSWAAALMMRESWKRPPCSLLCARMKA
ncbi:hypothetical protein ACFT5C_32295 [Streptomyces sp. NPDC057116]|uniref:hypothetical protein n=1 Tax=Streptomyces sp. NPDC057116 TaxID=3346023 RepID=UPI00362EC033